MENLGERLVGDYLRYVKECDFIDYNIYTTHTQGEIDVLGVKLSTPQAYICEVAVMLATGIKYKKAGRDTSEILADKFVRAIEYGEHALRGYGYSTTYMLWSPVVRPNQMKDVNKAKEQVLSRTGKTVELIINQDYLKAIEELRKKAREADKDLKSPLMRFLQIEENLRRRYPS